MDSGMSKIRYLQQSMLIDQAKYQALKENWAYSYQILVELNERITKEIDLENISIVAAGSYGRLEAYEGSDLDYMILTEHEDESLQEVREIVARITAELNIKPPNPTGVFSEIVTVCDMIEKTGAPDDNLGSLAQRMLLLMESRPLYNAHYFRSTVDRILRKYLQLVTEDPSKEALFLLNDTIRYFRSICVNYEHNFWKEEEKWVIRNVKLRHSRVIMYAGLLFIVLNASKCTSVENDKLSYIASKIELTPIEKLVHVYRDNSDNSYIKILGIYDFFMRKLSNASIRGELSVDYRDRYSNQHYSDLKVTSDALQTELTRFVSSQKGNWTEQVFEYLIF